MPALKWELQVKINTNDVFNTLTLMVIIHCYAKHNIDSNTHTHTHIYNGIQRYTIECYTVLKI